MLICGTDRSLPSVPRSKGCLTCVSRKTRCGLSNREPHTSFDSDNLVTDGRRPTCRACEDRKQACGGYRREKVVFLSEGWRALGVASVARSKMKKPISTNRSALLSSDSSTFTCSDIDNTDADLVFYPGLAIDRSHLHIAFSLASFGTRPFQALGSISHLFRYYLPLISSNVLDGHKCSSSSSTPVVFAVDALAYSHFGTANADPMSVRRSFYSYGMALQFMSVRLTEMKRGDSGFHNISEEDWQHFAFFCLVMAFYEVCPCRALSPLPGREALSVSS
jgi:hypothetical protein